MSATNVLNGNLPGTAPDGMTPPDPRRWLILGVIALAQLMVVLDATIVTIALPSAQQSLHFSDVDRQWVVTAYALAFGSLLLLGGRLADLLGRKVTFLGGLAAGTAGAIEVAAIHGTANASLVTGYGYTGVLVAFIARANPLGAVPVAILLGGIGASGGLLQRVFDLPDATVLVLQGLIFVVLLTSETLYGRFAFFKPIKGRDRT